MNSLLLAAFGWVVPGGSWLLMRRYWQFAGFALVVSAAFAGGLLLQGGCRWPQPADLAGLDSFTALGFQVAAFAKVLAGGPYLIAQFFQTPAFLAGRMHEYGTTLLIMAGLFNLLAISSAFDLRKGRKP